MARSPLGSLLGDIRRLYEGGAIGGQSDAQLLDRFRSLRDRAAFEVLVGRHGRMVLSVCREVLRDPDDAEDAFQATFLLLARKAGSLRVRRTLAGWLHRVGYRVAVQAGIAASRRRRHEEQAAAPSARAVGPPADAIAEAAESRRALHVEIDRLPDRLRVPVVLHYLEGRSCAEAATLLGVPEATVRGRLARARDRLRERLTDRGIEPAGESSPLPVPPVPVVSPGLIALAARAASWATLGPAAPAVEAAPSLALMQEVLGIMILSKLKLAAAGVAMILALAWMGASLAAPAARGDKPRQADAPAKAKAQAQPTGRPPSGTEPDAGGVIHYAGRVLGSGDRPIEGATVSLHYAVEGRPGEPARITHKLPNGSATLEFSSLSLKRAETDAAGRFRFDMDPSRLGDDYKDVHIRNIDLCVTAPGYGPVCVATGDPPGTASTGPRQPLDHLEIRLPLDDVPIVGKIINGQGHPLPGVKVIPVSFSDRTDPRGGPVDRMRRGSFVQHAEDFPILRAVTDDQGQFWMTGIGRERIVLLRIEVPGADPEEIEVVTHPGQSGPPLYRESAFNGHLILRYNTIGFVHRIPDAQARTVYVYVHFPGNRVESLRMAEWLTKKLNQETALRVIANPSEADLIMNVTITRRQGDDAAPPDPSARPRP